MVWSRALVQGSLVVLLLGSVATQAHTQSGDRNRPIRVGNSNVAFVGGGYVEHDHPTFGNNGLINLAYQRRILRREIRAVPTWIRVAVNFMSEERDTDSTYTYWNDPSMGEVAGLESVEERTSDFAVRVEALFDVLHTKISALYVGGGFVVHTVSFRSRGKSSGRNGASGLEVSENALAPSAVLGGRLFTATKPYTVYAEARLGNTYGRALGPQDVPPPEQGAPSVGEFALESVTNFSIEGGIAFHW